MFNSQDIIYAVVSGIVYSFVLWCWGQRCAKIAAEETREQWRDFVIHALIGPVNRAFAKDKRVHFSNIEFDGVVLIDEEAIPMVHVLHAGTAGCGAGPPLTWSNGKAKWVSIEDSLASTLINCKGCREYWEEHHGRISYVKN